MARRIGIAVSAGSVPLIAAAILIAILSAAACAQEPPTFLVAEPGLPDPLFSESVILMLPPPAIPIVAGVIINKPTTISVKRAFPRSVDLKDAANSVFFGGPVELETMLLIRQTSSPRKDERRIFDNLYLSVDPSSIAAILKDPKLDTTNVRVFQGYSDWAVPQLAHEKSEDSWYEVPARATSVFTPDPKQLWKQMVALAQMQEVETTQPPAEFRVLLSAFELPQP